MQRPWVKGVLGLFEEQWVTSNRILMAIIQTSLYGILPWIILKSSRRLDWKSNMIYVLTNLLWLLPMESTMGQEAKAEGFIVLFLF